MSDIWVRDGHTGTSLDLVCEDCRYPHHRGFHKDGCPYATSDNEKIKSKFLEANKITEDDLNSSDEF